MPVLLAFGISGAHFTQVERLNEKAFENERRLMREVIQLADRRSSDQLRHAERVVAHVCELDKHM